MKTSDYLRRGARTASALIRLFVHKMKTSDYLTRGAITVFALIVLFVHKQVTSISADNVTLVLLLLAVLPWLGSIFKSVKIPNLIEVELQELRKGVDEAKAAAESAGNVAAYAASGELPKVAETGISADQRLVELMQEYNNIRENQSSGPLRTQNMTRVVRQMADLATSATFDVAPALASNDRGRRLAAYAFLYEEPNFDLLEPLVKSLTKVEDKPFGQYWALRAVGRVLSEGGNHRVSTDVITMLQAFRARIKPGTDRDYELRQIFEHLRGGVTKD